MKIIRGSALLLTGASALVVPALALAAPTGATGIDLTAIKPYSDGIVNLINGVLVPLLMAVAFIVFLYGVFKYFIWNGDSDSERETGRTFALYGVIGFVIILSLWGLVNLTMGVLGLSAGTAPPYPTIGGSTTGGGGGTGAIGSTCTGSGRGTCNAGLTCNSAGICQAGTGGVTNTSCSRFTTQATCMAGTNAAGDPCGWNTVDNVCL